MQYIGKITFLKGCVISICLVRQTSSSTWSSSIPLREAPLSCTLMLTLFKYWTLPVHLLVLLIPSNSAEPERYTINQCYDFPKPVTYIHPVWGSPSKTGPLPTRECFMLYQRGTSIMRRVSVSWVLEVIIILIKIYVIY